MCSLSHPCNCLREAIFLKKRSKYGHSPEGGGGSTLAQMFWSTFYCSFIFGQNAEGGGGGKGLPKNFGALLWNLGTNLPLNVIFLLLLNLLL
jgi:hypothetical protein